jgi:hypothetical protein
MPPHQNGYDYDYAITEAHEGRIQRLESSMQEVVASTTATSVKVDHLVNTVEKGFAAISARLDKAAEQFNQHEAEIVSLKADSQSRAKRWAAVKGAAATLLAASAGAIATGFGKSIWEWLQALF